MLDTKGVKIYTDLYKSHFPRGRICYVSVMVDNYEHCKVICGYCPVDIKAKTGIFMEKFI